MICFLLFPKIAHTGQISIHCAAFLYSDTQTIHSAVCLITLVNNFSLFFLSSSAHLPPSFLSFHFKKECGLCFWPCKQMKLDHDKIFHFGKKYEESSDDCFKKSISYRQEYVPVMIITMTKVIFLKCYFFVLPWKRFLFCLPRNVQSLA